MCLSHFSLSKEVKLQNMLYAIGTRVVLKHTGLAGRVNDHLEGGMVEVQLDDGDEIPVFLEDILREDEYQEQLRKPVMQSSAQPSNTIISGTATKAPSERLGIQIAFDPIHDHLDQVSHYRIFLLNDTASDIIFTFSLFLSGALKHRTNNKLSSLSYLELGTMTMDQLNDSPEIEISCWEMTTSGSGYQQDKRLRIRAKQFFKKVRIAPLLNRPVHHYVVFEKLGQHDTTSEDLRTYTQRKTTPKHSSHTPDDLHEVSELANFTGEIDLHIEKLVTDHRKLSNADILRTQLKHFEQYMDKASALGVDRIFVIHGLGKGKLRDSIASKLISDYRVATFRNEYHARFGYGATEVVFR